MSAQDGLIGQTIGKCRILGRLGFGKTSTIFRAFYEPLHKEVALKILKEDMQASEEIRQKFIAEARSIASLDHENIVKVIDVAEADGYLMIIMELLKGRDTYRMVREDGPMEPERAMDVVLQTARALESAHTSHIVHRDVKPQNIMIVGRREQAKLVDFGLATRGAVAGKAGTPHFMSPEQIHGKKVDEKSDIYSLGATFYFLVAGKPPYSGKTRKDIFEGHLSGKLPTLSRANREDPSPKALDPILKRMMAPIPGYRYDARSLVQALEGVNLRARGRAQARHGSRAAARKKSPVPILIGVVGLIGVAIVLALVFTGGKKKQPTKKAGAQQNTTKQDTTKVGDLGVGQRGDAKAQRDAAANTAFRNAKDFEAANPADKNEIFKRYQAVYDQFADTGAGGKARARIKALDEERNAAQRAHENRVKAEKAQKGRVALNAKLEELRKKYDLAGMRKALEDYMDEYGEKKALIERFNRLEFGMKLFNTIGAEIDEENVMPLEQIRRGAPGGTVISAADQDGVTIRTASVEKKEPWSYLTPKEIADLASRRLNRKDPQMVFLVYAFLKEVGEEKQAVWKLDEARVVDRFGVVDQLLKKVSGGK